MTILLYNKFVIISTQVLPPAKARDLSPVWIIDSAMGFRVFSTIKKDNETPEGQLKLDKTQFMDGGFIEGSEIEVEEVTKAKGLEKLTLKVKSKEKGFESSEAIEILSEPEKINELKNDLKNKMIATNFRFTREVDGHKVELSYDHSEPTLKDETGTVEHLEKLKLVGDKPNIFNTILLFDVSGSMQEEDMLVKNISGPKGHIRTAFRDEDTKELPPELNEFLDKFEENELVSRIDGASLALFLFLSLKIGMGMGQQLQIFTFGDEVEPLTIQGPDGKVTPVFDVSNQDLKPIILNAIQADMMERVNEAKPQSTWMSKAIAEAGEHIDKFKPVEDKVTGEEIKYPVMIVLFTDGYPAKGDDEYPLDPLPFVKDKIAPRTDCVLYVVGVGDARDQLCQKMAELARGEYFRPEDLEALSQRFDSLAKEFITTIKVEEE